MNIQKLFNLYNNYNSSKISTNIHPLERMLSADFNMYHSIGRDAIRSIIAGLCLSADTQQISRVLDYGCGHGRVARHLRALFPSSEMFFADIRVDGIDFCAKEYNGNGILLDEDFSKQLLPTEIDLIWVGSVFTHIDIERAKLLYDKLFDALRQKGLLIITTHGRSKLTHKGRQSIGPKWAEKLELDYNKLGYAYVSYERKDLGNWGVSMMNISRANDFIKRKENCVLVLYCEEGWAGQDVLIFKKI